MKKYKVVDLREFKETIGYANNLREIKKLAKEQYEESEYSYGHTVWGKVIR